MADAPYESETAVRLRLREEAKKQAAVDMEKERKAALKAKAKRLGSAPALEGMAEFNKAALEVEKQINAKKEG